MEMNEVEQYVAPELVVLGGASLVTLGKHAEDINDQSGWFS
ncbi:hypothetical protein [Kribbella deserti]|uniref:Lasso RiPP family leader peptide-containing protein n=1 Tax=Kribbella deserti TaxID=1926257 RepID=A0ABV6QS58_9ACTN